MFRPGKPKDEPEPQAQPQPIASTRAPSEDTQQRYRASETTSTTGVHGSMSSEVQPNSGKAYTESDALARDIKEGTLTGFVGNGTNMTGEANFKGMLRVDGHLSGRVSSQDGTLIVSTGGQVDANVEVSVAQIYGTVNGDVVASKRIELGRVAKVTGNIQTPALVIEQGAIFEGSCRMAALRDEQSKAETRGASASAGTSSTPGASSSASGASGSGAAKTDTSSTPTASTSGASSTGASGASGSSATNASTGAGSSSTTGSQKSGSATS